MMKRFGNKRVKIRTASKRAPKKTGSALPVGKGTSFRPIRTGKRGFLLLEMLVATTLLAVGVTAALNAIFNSLKASREAQLYTQALFLGQEIMSLVETEVAFNDDYDVASGWNDFENAPNFQWRARVDEVDDFWTRRISVTIRWAENEQDLGNDERNFYYRLVTEVPRPRYPEDYRK